jgi:thiol:disulfide interchange protein
MRDLLERSEGTQTDQRTEHGAARGVLGGVAAGVPVGIVVAMLWFFGGGVLGGLGGSYALLPLTLVVFGALVVVGTRKRGGGRGVAIGIVVGAVLTVVAVFAAVAAAFANYEF